VHTSSTMRHVLVGVLVALVVTAAAGAAWAVDAHAPTADSSFPPPLASYGDSELTNAWEILRGRVQQQPFNLWATLLFLGAIVHTFLTHRFREIAHRLEERHRQRLHELESVSDSSPRQVSGWARVFHFLGEVEAVFGIWVLPLIILMNVVLGRSATIGYLNGQVNYTEAIFVVIIMAIASTRPILSFAESLLRQLAKLGNESPAAWWFTLLIAGPMLGSFITEPAAMTICASLLARRFYALGPSRRFAYATLGLLFVSISIGGTLTHFAAPPVLMVVDAWGWTLSHMLLHFGWKAALSITLSTIFYAHFFRTELRRLNAQVVSGSEAEEPDRAIPVWVTVGHLSFMVIAVLHSHHPAYLILSFLFFLAFVEVTEDFQRNFSLRPPVLVGFFLAGLVIHGGLQQWWIEPVLGSLSEVKLMLGATVLTAFNDNAAITFLCTLVPTFTEGMKYAAVAGAVTGGGLTVIANAPNPAGQSILSKYFPDGISAMGLFCGALIPTLFALASFLVFR